MKRLAVFLGLFLLLTCFNLERAYPQGFSGKEFWFAFLTNGDEGDATQAFQIHIACEKATKGIVSVPNRNWSQPVSVAANTVFTLTLPRAQVSNEGVIDGISNKGVRLVMEDSVILYLGNYQSYTSDAAVAIPVDALGTEFTAVAYGILTPQGVFSGDPFRSLFAVLATQDSTKVTITNTGKSQTKNAGSTYDIWLNRGEIYQTLCAKDAANGTICDLTGSTIVSTKPVAVFGGNTCSFVGGCPYCDHLFEQTKPSTTWGKVYNIASNNKTSNSLDVFRVTAAKNATTYTFNGAPFTLNKGQFRDHEAIGPVSVTSSEPINLTLYVKGSTCSAPPLQIDPLMMDILPEEQFASSYLFATSSYIRYARHYATIVIQDEHKDKLEMNGLAAIPTGGWRPLPLSNGWVYGYMDLIRGKTYKILTTNNKPFGVYVYGYGTEESYGFTGGGFLKSLGCTPEVINKIPADAGSDKTICMGDSTTIGSPAQAGFSYFWFPATGLDDPTKAQPKVKGTDTIVYTLKVKDLNNGCVKDDQVVVNIESLPVAHAKYSRDSLTISFTGPNDNRINKWLWDFGDRSTPSEEKDPSHTYVQQDIFTITLIVWNNCGSDTLKFQVKVDSLSKDTGSAGNPPTGLEQEKIRNSENSLQVKVYPNPVKDQAQVTFESRLGEHAELNIYAANGQKVHYEFVSDQSFGGIVHYTLEPKKLGLKPGLYFLDMKSGTRSERVRFQVN